MNADTVYTQPIFRNVGAKCAAAIGTDAQIIKFAKNETVLDSIKKTESVLIAQSGRSIAQYQLKENPPTVLKCFKRHDCIGLPELFGVDSSDGKVVAISSSEFFSVPHEAIRPWLNTEPALARDLCEHLAKLVSTMESRLSEMLAYNTAERVACLLLDLSAGRYEFEVPLTQSQMGSMIGVSREQVNRAVISFTKQGWMVRKDGLHKITNRNDMEKFAGR